MNRSTNGGTGSKTLRLIHLARARISSTVILRFSSADGSGGSESLSDSPSGGGNNSHPFLTTRTEPVFDDDVLTLTSAGR